MYIDLYLQLSTYINHNLRVRLDAWAMGTKRSFKDYLDMVGMDPNTKIMKINTWCHKNQWPTQALPYKLENKNK